MRQFLKLNSCPRVQSGQLKKAIPHCKVRSRQMPGLDHDFECCCWTKKGLLEYCRRNGIDPTFGLSFVCVLDDVESQTINPGIVEIIVDTHEEDSEIFEAIAYRQLGLCKMKHLDSGDVVIKYNHFTCAIEIKRGADYFNSLKSGRLHNQICRMLETHNFPILVVEDWHPYVSDEDTEDTIREKVRKHELSIKTFNRRITTYETKNSESTVDVIEELVRDLKMGKLNFMRRPVVVEKGLSDNLKIICSLPNIDRVIGERILDTYHTVEHALNNIDSWEEVDGIGKVKLARIKRTLTEGFDG